MAKHQLRLTVESAASGDHRGRHAVTTDQRRESGTRRPSAIVVGRHGPDRNQRRPLVVDDEEVASRDPEVAAITFDEP